MHRMVIAPFYPLSYFIIHLLTKSYQLSEVAHLSAKSQVNKKVRAKPTSTDLILMKPNP